MAQRLIPGVGFVDDAGLAGQYLIPGVGFAEFEAPGGGGASGSISATTDTVAFSGGASVSPVCSFSLTTDSVAFSGGASSGEAHGEFSVSTDPVVFSGGATGQTSGGVISIPEFRDWGTGNLLPGEAGVTVWIADDVTGELVVKLTGQESHASTAVCSVTHASIITATAYHVRVKLANGAQASWTLTAS